ncbi:DUF6090 family protein [Yeosuana sp. AK3]
MIKFFRKIRRKMLTENKFGKYLTYAIGEIILVVIGIMIALSINNWNEQNKNAHKEQIHLKGILSDLQEQVSNLRISIQGSSTSINVITDLLTEHSENDGFKQSDSLFYKINQLPKTSRATTIKTSFTELLQSGEINLIKNDGIRNSMILFYQKLEDFHERANSNITTLHHTVVQPVIQKVTLFKADDIGIEFDTDIEYEHYKYSDRIKSIALKKLQDPEIELSFINAINLKLLIESVQIARSNELINSANKLIKKIENEIVNPIN